MFSFILPFFTPGLRSNASDAIDHPRLPVPDLRSIGILGKAGSLAAGTGHLLISIDTN